MHAELSMTGLPNSKAETARQTEIQNCRWVEFSTEKGAPFTMYVPNKYPDFIPSLQDESAKIPFNRFQVGRKSRLIYDASGTGLEGHWAGLFPEEIKAQLDHLERTAYGMMVGRAGKQKVHAFLEDRSKQISPLLLLAGREAFEAVLACARAGRRSFELMGYYYMPDGTVKSISDPTRRERAIGFKTYVYDAPRIIDWHVFPKELGIFDFTLQQQIETLGMSPIKQEYGGLDAEKEPMGRFRTLSQVGRFASPVALFARRQFYK